MDIEEDPFANGLMQGPFAGVNRFVDFGRCFAMMMVEPSRSMRMLIGVIAPEAPAITC